MENRLESNYQSFLETHKEKLNSDIFTLLHMQWCLDHIAELPNEIHLRDSINMVNTDAPDFTRDRELYILAISIFILYWTINDIFPAEGETFLEEIKRYGLKSENFQDDISVTVLYHFFRTVSYFSKGDIKESLNSFDIFSGLTSEFKKKHDIKFIKVFKKKTGDRKIAMKVILERGDIFLREHIEYIERLMRKTSGQVANLNSDNLQTMLDALTKGDSDALKQILMEIDDK